MRVLAPLRLVMPLRAIPAMLVVITALLSTGVADATNHVRTVVSFDLAAGELPEGVAVDKRGNIFVSLITPVSEIRKIRPDGMQTPLTDLPTTGIGPLGLAVDAIGNVYVGLVSLDPRPKGSTESVRTGPPRACQEPEGSVSRTGSRSTIEGPCT
jgi:hypothetical protein